ncbi:MAG: FAD:protein FMN transferase [Candidatus Marinimicrobia bacterium]|nr:FAD:protein FMN transferase [Candidatus Neomarinimicrobiota bacterium]MBL7009987.1 FAD:protein FMN transferase [Candidatus Neomarinimicrobiota bacterium]MBL7029697.1 FAD:protein FMN transferase [Candidatus Neomarinimicrobiota bacterium]
MNSIKARHVLGFLILSLILSCARPIRYIEIHGNTMGTTYSIRIVPNAESSIHPETIQIAIDSILADIDVQMSTYRLDSEISIFNQLKKDEATQVSEAFATVLKRAIYWGEITNGAFDVSILPSVLLWRKGKPDREYPEQWEPPTDLESVMEMVKVGFDKINLSENNLRKSYPGQMIDLNAIAKGWGVDQLFIYIRNAGMKNFMVEIGGEVRTLGNNNKGSDWKIGIDKPMVGTIPGEEIYSVVSVSNQAMATSGNYRNFQEFNNVQYSHIIDPRTGQPTRSNIASVTVIASTCMDADALATALNVMGIEKGKRLVESLNGYEAFWILKENEQLKSAASLGMPILN